MEQALETEVPAGRRHIIERPRLTRLLDGTKARIIMLVVPAGYGKTTLARQWLEGGNRPYVWYAGTTASADVAALAVGIGDALRAVQADAGRRLRERLRATAEPERELPVLIDMLVDNLDGWPDDRWLVIDDYHFTKPSTAAEDFVFALSHALPIRLLVTTRERPSWASPRRVLYGEIYELGQTSLAMDQQEADEVLSAKEAAEASGLVALAEGWPAVIGLAAVARGGLIPEEHVPTALYDYFADELFRGATADVQDALVRLAIAPRTDSQLLSALFGSRATEIVAAAIRGGFLTPESRELHPLLREFLIEKLDREPQESVAAQVDAVGAVLLDLGRWDDVYAVVDRFAAGPLLEKLLIRSYEDLLREGRGASLARWVDRAHDVRLNAPVVTLIEAELAIRRGANDESEALAVQAARKMPGVDESAARAWEAAGRAAHLADREREALEYFRRAESSARTRAEVRNALAGQVLSGCQVEEFDVTEAVLRFEALEPETPTDVVRLAHCQCVAHYRHDALAKGSSAMAAAQHLAPRVEDPMVRSSFYNAFARALALQGRYADAEEFARRVLEEAETFHLDFVLPHAFAIRALVDLGLRRMRSATTFARRAEDAALAAGDNHNTVDARVIQAKLLLATGRAADAAKMPEIAVARRPTPAMYAEYLAVVALGSAVTGRVRDATRRAADANRLSGLLDVRALTTCVEAVLALKRGGTSTNAALLRLAALIETTNHVDAFVASYRACPELLLALHRTTRLGDELASIVDRARDTDISIRLGLQNRTRSTKEKTATLSARESDVYDLLAEGLQNREIAAALFISEATVKVHVRHILEKLRLRNRVEVAAHAARQRP